MNQWQCSNFSSGAGTEGGMLELLRQREREAVKMNEGKVSE